MLPFDLKEVIETVGYVGLFAIVFAESGLLIGFFLPGDSLLFTAGFLASRGIFDLPLLALVCTVAAITGDSFGYAFGRRVGRRLFQREDSRFFHKRNLARAEAFYEKHGGMALVLARFLPVVRTFVPIVAGVSAMEYRRFLFFNVFGGILWACGLTTAGYLLGNIIPDVDRYLLPIIVLIIVASVVPTGLHLLREYRHSRKK